MADPAARRSPGRALPSADLIRIIFVSQATRALAQEDWADIEARSHRNNLELGLTGLLAAQGCFFYGLLEGPRRRLLARMEVIVADDRHHSLRILSEERISLRRFANWSFARLPEESIRHLNDAVPGRFIVELSRRLA